MKKFLGAIITGAAIAAASAASAAPMDVAFDNTINVTAPDGTVVVSYRYYDNGTVGVTSPEGSITGSWELTDTNLCLTVMEQTNCFDVDEERAVGDSWTETDENGVVFTISINEGR